jgi:hypothetical protein
VIQRTLLDCEHSGQSLSGPISFTVYKVNHCHDNEGKLYCQVQCSTQQALVHAACHNGHGKDLQQVATAFEDLCICQGQAQVKPRLLPTPLPLLQADFAALPGLSLFLLSTGFHKHCPPEDQEAEGQSQRCSEAGSDSGPNWQSQTLTCL